MIISGIKPGDIFANKITIIYQSKIGKVALCLFIYFSSLNVKPLLWLRCLAALIFSFINLSYNFFMYII